MILASMLFACGDKEDDTGSDEAVEQEASEEEQEESPEDTGQD
tara:strand:- start:17 stop:145 length:129 start_codon:yes stop_codon:yes gene_type:complete